MKNIPENIAIECETRDEYLLVVGTLHKMGHKWQSCDPMTPETTDNWWRYVTWHTKGFYRTDTLKEGKTTIGIAAFLREYSEPEQAEANPFDGLSPEWEADKFIASRTKEPTIEQIKNLYVVGIREGIIGFIKSKQTPPFLFVTEDGTEIPLEKGFVYHVDGKEVSYTNALFASEHPELGPWFSTRDLAQATMPILTTEDGVKVTNPKEKVFWISTGNTIESCAAEDVQKHRPAWSCAEKAEDHLIGEYSIKPKDLIPLLWPFPSAEERIKRYIRQQLKLD